MTKMKVTAEDILPWVKKRKSFTTKQVAKEFKVSEGSARALLAILRIQKHLPESSGKGADGTSQWVL